MDLFILFDKVIVKIDRKAGGRRVVGASPLNGIGCRFCRQQGLRLVVGNTVHINRGGIQGQPGREFIADGIVFRDSIGGILGNIRPEVKVNDIADTGVIASGDIVCRAVGTLARGMPVVYIFVDGLIQLGFRGLNQYRGRRSHFPLFAGIIPLGNQIHSRGTVDLHAIFNENEIIAHKQIGNIAASHTTVIGEFNAAALDRHCQLVIKRSNLGCFHIRIKSIDVAISRIICIYPCLYAGNPSIYRI